MHPLFRLLGTSKEEVGRCEEENIQQRRDKDIEGVIGKDAFKTKTFVHRLSWKWAFLRPSNGNGDITGTRDETILVLCQKHGAIAVPAKGNIGSPLDAPMHVDQWNVESTHNKEEQCDRRCEKQGHFHTGKQNAHKEAHTLSATERQVIR